eukprot:TRINITY_DN94_c0_g1_i15.p1 TRINITY_DN94_c0_g1~~TRINITY_DN94_c0_g1_i15.p1  ORF type:complete len:108 (+),score=2.47 TRINITY_DN94_c0_g1_i15:1167-1490(+)
MCQLNKTRRLEVIEKHILSIPHKSIFLASDNQDLETMKYLTGKYNISRYNVRHPAKYTNALIDLWTLSQANNLIIHGHSTFTQTAIRYRNYVHGIQGGIHHYTEKCH